MSGRGGPYSRKADAVGLAAAVDALEMMFSLARREAGMERAERRSLVRRNGLSSDKRRRVVRQAGMLVCEY